MTKKDFELIARVLSEQLASTTADTPRDAVTAVECVAYRFARALANENPRFNRGRFLAACGVPA